MTSEIQGYLDKAVQYLKSAKMLYKAGDVDSAASRLYYSMFYCVSALLLADGMKFSSHRGVISSFGEKFVKTGRVSPKYHEWLRDAFDKRQYGDYRAPSGLESGDVRLMLERADSFLELARKLLKDKSGDTPSGIAESPAVYKAGKKKRVKRTLKRPKA